MNENDLKDSRVDPILHHPVAGKRLAELYDGSPLARDIEWKDVGKLTKFMELREYGIDETIFNEGDTDSYMALILCGKVEIVKKSHSDGLNPKFLVFMGPGRILGELSVIDGSPRSAAAISRETSLLLVLTKSNFEKLCLENKHIGLIITTNIARLMSLRLRRTSDKLVEYL